MATVVVWVGGGIIAFAVSWGVIQTVVRNHEKKINGLERKFEDCKTNHFNHLDTIKDTIGEVKEMMGRLDERQKEVKCQVDKILGKLNGR